MPSPSFVASATHGNQSHQVKTLLRVLTATAPVAIKSFYAFGTLSVNRKENVRFSQRFNEPVANSQPCTVSMQSHMKG